ncbi:serine/threonine-protein kinase [Metabacillus malikii]|uniref:Serine/threonine-protein kinase n=1 Tax=Metabacillus malikii TaxID=1504265 RepID=A0ABT9ZMR6_9BACI|nr:serine/threonine-protein kinase [Metabacillus malikii]MDQ0233295.1 serine/threonine-protein kinase [Metabacillus malikii]
MMKSTTMNQAFNVSPGKVIKGKWNGKTYKIIKLLGQGATGSVYLAIGHEGQVAIKLSKNSMAITSEVNVLKRFATVQGTSLGPSLLDVDDWVLNNNKIAPFYVMEYIEGNNFLEFVQQKGTEWADVLILQLLGNIEKLHRQGWVFGDLKPENLLISGPPPQIRCIDVGGTTQQGRSIKEFTEFFDRGYWGLGTRKAEPSYDLFAIAMILINAAYPKRFTKKDSNGKSQLFEAINQNSFLRKHKLILHRALLGEYHDAIEMKSDFVQMISEGTHKANSNSTVSKKNVHIKNNKPSQSQYSKPKQRYNSRRQVKKGKKVSGFIETIIILISVFIIYSLYVYHTLM